MLDETASSEPCSGDMPRSQPAQGDPGPSPTKPDSDEELVDRARGGDRAAFGRLYERFGATVHGVLLANVPRQDVHDLVHDVFLSAWKSLDALDAPARFGAWLVSIARNRARDAHRLRRAVEELPEELGDSSERVDDERQARDLLEAVRALPEAYRTTLVLRLVEGLTGPEIAERTGLTHGSVRVNLHRGMKLLRERFDPEDET